MDLTDRFYKNNIVLSNCVFLTSHREGLAVDPLIKYLSWHRVHHGVVRNAIFLRSKAAYGIGCGFFKTCSVKIHDIRALRIPGSCLRVRGNVDVSVPVNTGTTCNLSFSKIPG